MERHNKNVVLLAGGVGGAKLASGLAETIPPENLSIIVNTGDDFQHLGLTICPDLDTIMYTLAGEANPETGWGRVGESWRTMGEVKRLQGLDWFSLGDLDLATHLVRTHMLADGASLTEVTAHLCRQFGVRPTVLPMSNQPAPTIIESEEDLLPFQTWFVQQRWQPAVKAVRLPDNVKTSKEVAFVIEKADIVLIAPSNPFVSINPILEIYPIRAMLTDLPALVIGVSPLVGGQAVKGPTAKMMGEMGLDVTPAGIVHFYNNLLDAFIYDVQDEGALASEDMATLCTNTLMKTPADRVRLAKEVITFGLELLDS